jgi:septation ring formation regulator EzrA
MIDFRKQIYAAIDTYKQSNLQETKAILRKLQATSLPGVKSDLFIIYQWIELAVNRVTNQLGEDDLVCMPVVSSLERALFYLEKFNDSKKTIPN